MQNINKRHFSKFHILIFLELFMTSGFSFVNNLMPRSLVITIWLLMIAMLLKSKMRISKRQACIVVALAVIITISSIINHEELLLAAFYIFPLFVVLLLQSALNYEDFKVYFVEIIYVLCIVSLIGFAVFTLIPQANSLFTVYGVKGKRFSNLILFVYRNNYRNQGMFWEPGAFQTFINLAILYEIFADRINKKRLIVYIICIITTFSTTGYACTLLIIIIFLLGGNTHVNRNYKSTKHILIALLAISSIILFSFGDYLFSVSSNTIFGKLIIFFNRREYLAETGNQLSSASIRFFSIIKPIEVFFNKPIFGYGYSGLSEYLWQFTFGMNTCTFINYFAVYGVFYGLIMMVGFLRNARFVNKTGRGIISLLVFITFFLITASEDYVNNSFFVLLVLYGYSYRNDACNLVS